MKKIFTFIAALAAALSLSAAETTLWESTYTDGVEINSETVASFKAGDILRVYVTVLAEKGANFKICYKGAPDWSETTIPSLDSQWPWVNGGEDHFDLTFTQEDITAFSGKNIYIYQGENSLISKVTLVTEGQDPDPQPGDPTIVPADPSVPGAYEKILWQGDSAISWNAEAYAGGEFETAADLFAGLQQEDTIRVYTAGAIEGAQYNLTYKAGASWEWTALNTTVENGVIRYVVESPAIAQEIAERGIIVRGQGYHMTCITMTAHQQDTITPVDPQPTDSIDLTGLVETVLWTGNAAISWNSEEYAGDKLDTRSISETLFAGLQENDIICVTYAEAAADAQFGLQYKAGDDWSWTDLNCQLSTVNYQLLYRVASDEMAMLIADRGLVITGIKYHATKISLFSPKTEGVENVQENNAPAIKFIENGVLYIKYKGTKYNVQGAKLR